MQAENPLGRAWLRSDVAAVLFDEPLTVNRSRIEMAVAFKIKALHRELDLTIITSPRPDRGADFADTVVVNACGA